MKLKNLLIASAGLFLFGACSNGGDDEPAMQSFEANLSISAVPSNGTTTKADEVTTDNGTANEQIVHSLTAYVFNSSDAFVTTKTVTSETGSVDSIPNIIVKVNATSEGAVSTDAFKVFLIANATLKSIPSTVADLKTALIDKDITSCTVAGVAAKTQYIPMFSAVVSNVTGLVAGKTYNNWVEVGSSTVQSTVQNGTFVGEMKVTKVGTTVTPTTEAYTMASTAKIALSRYVARVELESIKTAFTENYSNAQFILNKVSMANVSSTSYAYSDADISTFPLMVAAPTYYRGFPETIVRADYYLADGTYDASIFSKAYTETLANNSTTNLADLTEGIPQFYAFEHSNTAITGSTNKAYTMLIITGRIVNNGITSTERSFRIPIKESGANEGVKHNYIYKVNVTLTGEGTDNPDKNMLNAYLSVKITVAPWTVVNQVENDVN